MVVRDDSSWVAPLPETFLWIAKSRVHTALAILPTVLAGLNRSIGKAWDDLCGAVCHALAPIKIQIQVFIALCAEGGRTLAVLALGRVTRKARKDPCLCVAHPVVSIGAHAYRGGEVFVHV